MAQFNIAYQITKGNEGGYANAKNDTGGETYKGISRVNNPTWPGWVKVDAYKKAHGAIKNNFIIPDPTLDALVSPFYKTNYWDKFKGDQITSQDVANIMFDFAVTSGVGTSVKNTQKAAGVTADGAFGPDSLKAVNAAPPVPLATKILQTNQAYYNALAAKDPEAYGWALKSWTDRIKYFEGLVAKVPGGATTVSTGAIIITGVGLFFLGKKLKWW